MAHGVFECWLHPARYRTQPCKDGTACRRRVCFFAHTPEQLRVLPQSPKTPLESYDGSPMRRKMAAATTAGGMGFSPPLSPTGGAEEEEAVLAAAMRKLQLGRVRSGLGFLSVPTTPTKVALGFEEEEEGKVVDWRAFLPPPPPMRFGSGSEQVVAHFISETGLSSSPSSPCLSILLSSLSSLPLPPHTQLPCFPPSSSSLALPSSLILIPSRCHILHLPNILLFPPLQFTFESHKLTIRSLRFTFRPLKFIFRSLKIYI